MAVAQRLFSEPVADTGKIELEEKVTLLPHDQSLVSAASAEDSNSDPANNMNQLVHINVLPKNIVPGAKLFVPISLNISHWSHLTDQGLKGIKIR